MELSVAHVSLVPTASSSVELLLPVHASHILHGPQGGKLRLLRLGLGELGLVLLLLLPHPQLLAEPYEVVEALEVVRVRLLDVLVGPQRLLVGPDAPVAGRNHEAPLHLLGLDLRGLLEVLHGFLVHLRLDEVGAEPGDHFHVHREELVRLVVLLVRRPLVVLSSQQTAIASKHSCIRLDQGDESLVGDGGFLGLLHLVVDDGDVVVALGGVRHDGVELVEGLQRSPDVLLVVQVVLEHVLKVRHALAAEAEVEDRLDAVRLHPDAFHVQLLRHGEVLPRLVVPLLLLVRVRFAHLAVPLVHQSLGVVSVRLDRLGSVLVCFFDVSLEVVDEAEVGVGSAHRRRVDLVVVLPLESFERLLRSFRILLLQEVDRFGDLHVACNVHVVLALLQHLNDVVETSNKVLLDLWSYQLGCLQHQLLRLGPIFLVCLLQLVLFHYRFVFVLVLNDLVVLVLLTKIRVLDIEQLGKTPFHLLFVSQSKVADNEVESGLKIWFSLHARLVRHDRILVISHSNKRIADVSHDLEPQVLARVRNLV
mmetsp:Transcript_11459/g.26169  ORF Transcript_11459/g.26169 Transcript_11459/m.26169 type:complete len:535 (+) Transcript_11459:335-1939(+)